GAYSGAIAGTCLRDLFGDHRDDRAAGDGRDGLPDRTCRYHLGDVRGRLHLSRAGDRPAIRPLVSRDESGGGRNRDQHRTRLMTANHRRRFRRSSDRWMKTTTPAISKTMTTKSAIARKRKKKPRQS